MSSFALLCLASIETGYDVFKKENIQSKSNSSVYIIYRLSGIELEALKLAVGNRNSPFIFQTRQC